LNTRLVTRTLLFYAAILLSLPAEPVYSWSWDSADNNMPSLREDLDREIAQYRVQVNNGLAVGERIFALDRLIGNYKPMGINVSELEIERSRLVLEEKQQALRASQAQDEATKLYDTGVYQYRQGQYQLAHDTFREAERLLPQDKSIKEIRRKLSNVYTIIEIEDGVDRGSEILRLAIARYIENDMKRAMNALIYADNINIDRPEVTRMKRLIESEDPDMATPSIPAGVKLVDHKLQLTLEAIYDGRYLSAISECMDVLDLEPDNVQALTRLGSAYFAMNEREKARQIWTKALQLDPKNVVLRKFLYGSKGASRVEAN
jgi:tetratricopeptide (TPR) repeat protein